MNSGLSHGLSALAGIALMASLPPAALAQQLSPEEMAARRQSVVNLEKHIEQRRERLNAIVFDIRTLDDRVEDGVNEIVTMLTQIKDSPESRVRVATVKADVITGLRRSIDYYNKNRDAIREQLRTGKTDLPKETLQSDLAKFDERIEKRINQIAELAKSFTDPQELEKYEVTAQSSWAGGWYGGGWFDENVEISEDWKQNRRESRHTEAAKEGVSEGLKEAIENLQKRNSYLESKLKESGLSDIEREFYQSDIARNNALMKQRQKQLEDFSTGSATVTESVDPGQAHEVDQMVQSARGDLREDFFSIFRKYAELNRARAELKLLEENLAARKQWLKEHE